MIKEKKVFLYWLRDASVKDRMITLPHGTSYRVLVLSPVKTMHPEVLIKIKQLVYDDGIVLGVPPTHSSSLENQPQADKLVKNGFGTMGTVDGVKQTKAKIT